MSLKKFYDAVNKAEARVNELAAQITTLFENEQYEEAEGLRPQFEKAKADAKNAHEFYLSMQEATSGSSDPAKRFVPVGGDLEPAQVKKMRGSNEYTQAFIKALKVGASPKGVANGQHSGETFGILMDALTETGGSPAGAEGGFLLPDDMDTMIATYRRLAVDLSANVSVETVTAYTGWRAHEVAAAALPFALITESDFPSGERIPAMESPTFKRVEFTVKKYGGYLPVASDLLNDTPANIMNYLANWCGRKESLTYTYLIKTELLATLSSPTAVTDPDDIFTAINTALNVTLDPAISASAEIWVNQSGLDLMDGMLDGNGRPYLQPDPTNATVLRYKGRKIVVIPNSQLANTDTNTKTYVAVGDGRELIKVFKRMAGEMTSTNIGGTAWRNDNTEVKYILRADVVDVDASGMVLLHVTL